MAFPLPNPYVRPGGFFKMFVYWDSYFTLLGLVVQGRWELAAGIVDNMIYAIEQLGHLPGYVSSKTVCRSRSQPPFLTSAIREVAPFVADGAWLSRAVAAAEREYLEYWMAEPHVTDLGLSRYFDSGDDGCVTMPDTPHHRAIAESGWDNTARFGDDATMIVPVDLNAQLFRYEQDLADLCATLGRSRAAAVYQARVEARRELINRHLWVTAEGFFRDLDLRTGQPLRPVPRAVSAFVPLWAGVANARQAASLAAHLPLFEHDHGLATTEPSWADEDQHDYPTGWAYSHWYVTQGLLRYGYRDEAVRIALKWLRLVAGKLHQDGAILSGTTWSTRTGRRRGATDPSAASAGQMEYSPHCLRVSCLASMPEGPNRPVRAGSPPHCRHRGPARRHESISRATRGPLVPEERSSRHRRSDNSALAPV